MTLVKRDSEKLQNFPSVFRNWIPSFSFLPISLTSASFTEKKPFHPNIDCPQTKENQDISPLPILPRLPYWTVAYPLMDVIYILIEFKILRCLVAFSTVSSPEISLSTRPQTVHPHCFYYPQGALILKKIPHFRSSRKFGILFSFTSKWQFPYASLLIIL